MDKEKPQKEDSRDEFLDWMLAIGFEHDRYKIKSERLMKKTSKGHNCKI